MGLAVKWRARRRHEHGGPITASPVSVAGFTWVQSAYGSTPAQQATVSATYTSNVSAGNKLIALVSTDDASILSMACGDGTHSMTQLASAAPAGRSVQVFLFAMDVPAADVGTKPTITATASVGFGDSGILIQEVSGLLAGNTSAMLDGTPGTTTGTGGGSTTSPAYSSAAANEYLVCCFGDNAFTDTITNPAGYTADPANPSGATVHTLICYKQSAGAAESGVYTYSNAAASYGSILGAFKLA